MSLTAFMHIFHLHHHLKMSNFTKIQFNRDNLKTKCIQPCNSGISEE